MAINAREHSIDKEPMTRKHCQARVRGARILGRRLRGVGTIGQMHMDTLSRPVP